MIGIFLLKHYFLCAEIDDSFVPNLTVYTSEHKIESNGVYILIYSRFIVNLFHVMKLQSTNKRLQVLHYVKDILTRYCLKTLEKDIGGTLIRLAQVVLGLDRHDATKAKPK